MDFASIIGFIFAFAIVAAAMILGGSALVFINAPSLLIVVGGTFGVVMMKFGLGQFFGAVKISLKAFFFKEIKSQDIIEEAISIATLARKEGLLALEKITIKNELLKSGVQLLTDGHEADVVKGMLKKDMLLTLERHLNGQKIFKAIGDAAPAMGMIGTLIGLVQMLSAMDDPKSIGPAMAVALLTTLYGAMIANMVALPIADKLNLRSEQERLTRSLIIDALSSIQAGQNPRIIEEFLKSYLHKTKRSEKK